jgi:putative ABC transport system permease protein
MGWLRNEQVVPDDVRLQAGLAFGFLLICVVNTVGLLLAKCLRRSQEIGVRRALGATRRAIFTQFMVEAGIVGMAGGLLGLVFAELGLWASAISRRIRQPRASGRDMFCSLSWWRSWPA